MLLQTYLLHLGLLCLCYKNPSGFLSVNAPFWRACAYSIELLLVPLNETAKESGLGVSSYCQPAAGILICIQLSVSLI